LGKKATAVRAKKRFIGTVVGDANLQQLVIMENEIVRDGMRFSSIA